MKIKDMKKILDGYEDNDDLYLLLENGYGKTCRHSIDCNKVDRHFLLPNPKQVQIWLGWSDGN